MQSLRRSGMELILPTAAATLLILTLALAASSANAAAPRTRSVPAPPPLPPQETGFLNRVVELHGLIYKFQVYVPEEYRRPEPAAISGKAPSKEQTKEPEKEWPIILFLHGRGRARQ